MISPIVLLLEDFSVESAFAILTLFFTSLPLFLLNVLIFFSFFFLLNIFEACLKSDDRVVYNSKSVLIALSSDAQLCKVSMYVGVLFWCILHFVDCA